LRPTDPLLGPTDLLLRPTDPLLGQPLIVKSKSNTPPEGSIQVYTAYPDFDPDKKYKYTLLKHGLGYGVIKTINNCLLVYHKNKVYLKPPQDQDLGTSPVSLYIDYPTYVTLYFLKGSDGNYELYYPTLELSPTRGGDAIIDYNTGIIYDFKVKVVVKYTLGGSRKTRKLKRKEKNEQSY
jgi:hypothetical protein